MTSPDCDSDGFDVDFGPTPDCGICGREMGRWSHQHPHVLVCLNCDRVDVRDHAADWAELIGDGGDRL
jgi:hypothetical protein